MHVVGKQHGYVFKEFSEKEGESGWANMGGGGAESGAWWVTLSLVWSLCTWHGRKLTMKGGSDYCLINTERESPHLPPRIRWGTCQSGGSSMDPARRSVPKLTFTCLIKHLYLFLSPFTGSFFLKLWSFLSLLAAAAQSFPKPHFLCVIIMNEVGRTANTPYLKQTLVVTALSSHCAEESPTNRTPSYLSLQP